MGKRTDGIGVLVNSIGSWMKIIMEVEKMLRSESEIRAAMIETLKAQIEAVETDDEAQYIVNNAKQTVYAYVLQLNVYGRDFVKENYKK